MLEPGDTVCFPAGPEGAHQVFNRSSEVSRFLILSTNVEPAVAVYPDSNKIGVWPGGDLDDLMVRRGREPRLLGRRALTLYDRIGRNYATGRRTEPRIAAQIHAALGDARTVINVGAGAGSYEPSDREVVAVEPSSVMLAQRPADAAPAIQATAESLPFADGAFDAAMALLTDHHWRDQAAGYREMRRVARRLVMFTWDERAADEFWLARDYLPGIESMVGGLTFEDRCELLGATRVEPVLVPHDCVDGFMSAYWGRPEAYLDPAVRDVTSVFATAPPDLVADGIARLAADLASGAWDQRHGSLRSLPELDTGPAPDRARGVARAGSLVACATRWRSPAARR